MSALAFPACERSTAPARRATGNPEYLRGIEFGDFTTDVTLSKIRRHTDRLKTCIDIAKTKENTHANALLDLPPPRAARARRVVPVRSAARRRPAGRGGKAHRRAVRAHAAGRGRRDAAH